MFLRILEVLLVQFIEFWMKNNLLEYLSIKLPVTSWSSWTVLTLGEFIVIWLSVIGTKSKTSTLKELFMKPLMITFRQ
ncbi:hypothetical protein COU88_02235 [Candidatus Roizmanbacteria bacterium CG10_big_fil_rev_8_21_14_0_10_39_6]|uniref:Uncharacterized protein n=1 Tax=Candidatus Roizmanbacteria bacterium CG10_big_fil_rev_8_21_14_0_10_39_6 TaxID=1974853 RepID=A0A2M8KSQ7_9BACT|nr:MAG: hypothetical protein COU88_02235 [Candidatus Roizmanbacteria bacterium CG10_big_fil_rev_8_21_14_0_10_39_6]